jgi:hypothetical protein
MIYLSFLNFRSMYCCILGLLLFQNIAPAQTPASTQTIGPTRTVPAPPNGPGEYYSGSELPGAEVSMFIGAGYLESITGGNGTPGHGSFSPTGLVEGYIEIDSVDLSNVDGVSSIGTLSVNGVPVAQALQVDAPDSAISTVSVSPSSGTTFSFNGEVASCYYASSPTGILPPPEPPPCLDDCGDPGPELRSPQVSLQPSPAFTQPSPFPNAGSCLYASFNSPVSVTYGLPQITSISQNSANIGTSGSFTVTGTNLEDSEGTSASRFNTTIPNFYTNISTSVTTPGQSSEPVSFSIPITQAMGTYQFTISNIWGTSNAVNFTVGAPGATITSINPPTWTAGTTFPLTISGSNFGTAPTLSISGVGITYTNPPTVQSGGNQMQTTVTVAANTPNELAPVSVQPGYVGSSFTCGNCNGGSPIGSAVATVQAMTPMPQIMFNGSNITGTTQTVRAGQKIALSVSAPSNYSIVSQSWSSPPGSAVGGFNVSSSSGSVVPLPSATTQNYTFYWADSGNSRQITYTYTLDNGQNNSATATFNVEGPANSNIKATPGTVNIWPVGIAAGGQGNQPYLEFGNAGTNTGMSFEASADLPESDQGAYSWVQLIQSYSQVYCSGKCNPPQMSLPGLDNTYPYSDGSTASDSPGIGIVAANSEEALDFHATMYLMWTPTVSSQCSGDSCAIPIPLGSINWQFSGDAINTLSSLTGVSGTSWVLNNCSSGGASQFIPNNGSSAYPTWTNTFQNISPNLI